MTLEYDLNKFLGYEIVQDPELEVGDKTGVGERQKRKSGINNDFMERLFPVRSIVCVSTDFFFFFFFFVGKFV